MYYYQRNLGDYARDTGDLTMLQHGAFNLLLDRYYSDGKPLKASKVYGIGKARNQAERDAVDFVLNEYFKLDGELWLNAKADAVIKAAEEKSDKAAKSAKSRWDAEEVMRTHSERTADALPESSERNANQYPVTNNQEPKEQDQKQQPAAASPPPPLVLEPEQPKASRLTREKSLEVPDWLDREAWSDWCAFRKRGKAPFTAHAQTLAMGKLEVLHKSGHKARAVIDQSIERGWSGLFEVKGGQQRDGNAQHSHSRAAGIPLE